MFFIKSAFCRVFQTAFRIALPILPYREPEIINSCTELGKVLNKENATRAKCLRCIFLIYIFIFLNIEAVKAL